MQPVRERRKKIFINRDIQLPMALTVIIFILIYVVAFVLIIIVPLILGLEMGSTGGGDGGSARELMKFHNYLWIPLLVIVIILTIRIVHFGHRIAGPVFRIKQYLHTMKDGNFSRDFTLREQDMLKDVEQSLNQFAQQMRSDFLQLKNAQQRCEKHAQEIVESLVHEGKKNEADLLVSFIHDMGKSLDKFKVNR